VSEEGIAPLSPLHEVERRMTIMLPIRDKAECDATNACLEGWHHIAPSLRCPPCSTWLSLLPMQFGSKSPVAYRTVSRERELGSRFELEPSIPFAL
jgi:hypothetical protein